MSRRVTRVAGQHARRRVRLLALRALLILGGIVVITLVAALSLGWRSFPFVIVELIAIVAMTVVDRLAFPIIDRWDRGATGEEHVGKILDALTGAGWRPIHDVDTSRGNVDHVVVGPGGVFTIETKSHPGRLHSAKLESAWLRQAYAQCKAIERIVGEPTTPLLVFSRAYLTPAVSRQRGVTVLPARMLAGHLDRRAQKLDAVEVARIHTRLRAAVESLQR